jgi:hypothetical protein
MFKRQIGGIMIGHLIKNIQGWIFLYEKSENRYFFIQPVA